MIAASEAFEMKDGRAVLRLTDAARARSLVFDPDAHKYFVDGREHVSCTTIAQAIQRLQGYEMPDFRPIHSNLGTAMHRAIELDILGILDESTVDERIWPKVLANRGWRRLTHFEPAWLEDVNTGDLQPALELRLWSPEGCAGTVDAIGCVAGQLTIVDWKSSYVGAAAIQLAGYARMLRFMFDVEIDRRLVVRHLPDETFQAVPFSDPLDERRFAAGLFLVRDHLRHGNGGMR